MALKGIDISSHQTGIDLSVVPCDFVIVKATEGVGYTNPDFARAYNQAKAAGKCLGIYHYASGGSAINEANYFLNTVGSRVGEAILVLDWESYGNSSYGSNDYNWCKTWLDYVAKKTGVNPMLYCSQSIMGWFSGIGNYGMWIAQYADMNPTGYQENPWNEGAYSCAMRQYSSCGRLSGYDGNLDLNKFYGDRTAWGKYAKGPSSSSGGSSSSGSGGSSGSGSGESGSGSGSSGSGSGESGSSGSSGSGSSGSETPESGGSSSPGHVSIYQPGTSSSTQPRYNVMVNGTWLDTMQGIEDTGGSGDDYGGRIGSTMQYLAIEGVGKYRVTTKAGGCLPWVTKRNLKDLANGCAGDGSPIIAVEIPNKRIKYQVHVLGGGWLDWVVGNSDTGGSSDTYAGNMNAIDAIRIKNV